MTKFDQVVCKAVTGLVWFTGITVGGLAVYTVGLLLTGM